MEELQEVKKPSKKVNMWLSTLGASRVVSDHGQIVNSNVTLEKTRHFIHPAFTNIQGRVTFLEKEFFVF